MNFKILVLASLVAAAVVADDTFLMESDFGRYLAANYTYAQSATACTADSGCVTSTASGTATLTSCCATWYRNATTSLGKYCLPVVQLGGIFTYNYSNYTATGCTTTATTATSAGAACTANSDCTKVSASTCCISYAWSNATAAQWTYSSSLGSYCGTNVTYSSIQAYTYVNVGATTAAYVKGEIDTTYSCMADPVVATTTFGVYMKATVAVLGSILAFLFY